VVQGFCRILPDFRGAEQPSLPLKVLLAQGFWLVQQALVMLCGTDGYAWVLAQKELHLLPYV
jgi:hypothetical protein